MGGSHRWPAAGAASTSPSVPSLVGVIYTWTGGARAISVYGLVTGLAAASGQLVGNALWRPIDRAGLGRRP
jgi:hypothetical protein